MANLRYDPVHATRQTAPYETAVLVWIGDAVGAHFPSLFSSEPTLSAKPFGNLAACIFLMLWSISDMSSRVVLPLLLAVLLTCCGKSPRISQPNTASAVEPSQGEKTEAVPGTAQPAVGATLSNASEAALNAALGELTQAVRKYSFEHQRVPKTVAEVVAAGYLKSMPQAPQGKKFAIDAKTVQVVLVNQ